MLKKPLSAVQLRLLHAIATTGKLDHAAQISRLSQPAASRMLAGIEDQVGMKLFERHPKGMRNTSVGLMLAEKAGAIVSNLDDFTETVSALETGAAGHLKVGAVTGPAIDTLIPAVQTIKQESPELEVSVELGTSRFLLEEMIAGRLEFVIARLLPDYDPHAFRIEPGRHETVRFLTSRDNPLASRDTLTLEDLHAQEWVIQQRGNPIREVVADAFRIAGFEEPRNIVNSSSVLFMISYLTRGRAIAATTLEVAELLTRPPIEADFVMLDVQPEIHVTPFYLVSMRDRSLSPAALKLKSQVRRIFSSG